LGDLVQEVHQLVPARDRVTQDDVRRVSATEDPEGQAEEGKEVFAPVHRPLLRRRPVRGGRRKGNHGPIGPRCGFSFSTSPKSSSPQGPWRRIGPISSNSRFLPSTSSANSARSRSWTSGGGSRCGGVSFAAARSYSRRSCFSASAADARSLTFSRMPR